MSNRTFIILFCGAVTVYGLNLRLDIMQVDAAQYAEMGWEMLVTKDFLHLHCLTHDYLDKPPLIFWLGSLSFFVFGINNFAYRIPSLIFALLAVYSTYRFTKVYYDKKTARMAAVILATTEAVFLITNDVRTDTLLMGAVISSIWQLVTFFEEGKTANLLVGSVGIGLAMLAKGPIGIVAPAAALLPHIIWQKKWKRLFDFRLFIALAIIGLVLLPMCIGLYQQFGAKGLQFYFWKQSFGRITGESEWNNHPDTFFLVHSTAWAFMPWSLFLFVGWLVSLVTFVKNKFSPNAQREIISLSGFTLILLALSLSKYQLPHYIFVTYPLAAVIAARCYIQASSWGKARYWITGIQILILVAIILVTFLIQYSLKGFAAVSLICLLCLYPLAVWGAIKLNGSHNNYYTISRYLLYRFRSFYGRIFGNKNWVFASIIFGLDVAYRHLFVLSAAVFIAFNMLVSAFYFPALLKYQPENDFGRYVNKTNMGNNFVCYGFTPDFALVFYAQHVPAYVLWDEKSFEEVLNNKLKLVVCASQSALSALSNAKIPFKIIDTRESFGITQLTPAFLNPRNRENVCGKFYLLEVTKP